MQSIGMYYSYSFKKIIACISGAQVVFAMVAVDIADAPAKKANYSKDHHDVESNERARNEGGEELQVFAFKCPRHGR